LLCAARALRFSLVVARCRCTQPEKTTCALACIAGTFHPAPHLLPHAHPWCLYLRFHDYLLSCCSSFTNPHLYLHLHFGFPVSGVVVIPYLLVLLPPTFYTLPCAQKFIVGYHFVCAFLLFAMYLPLLVCYSTFPPSTFSQFYIYSPLTGLIQLTFLLYILPYSHLSVTFLLILHHLVGFYITIQLLPLILTLHGCTAGSACTCTFTPATLTHTTHCTAPLPTHLHTAPPARPAHTPHAHCTHTPFFFE